MNRPELDVVGRHGQWADLRVLIDGIESLKGTDDSFGADEILRSGALLPINPPRRIALYTCSCGATCCSNVSVIVSRDGDCIRWSSFMSITGEFDNVLPPEDDPDPLLNDEEDDIFRHPLELPDLAFDATEYLAEVKAALRQLEELDAGPPTAQLDPEADGRRGRSRVVPAALRYFGR
ncbi:hypothetical protein [Solicola sp. PLA-1-18]|uniref:hypothetical protein n=1 Tax=Solicola sp. PLA-1-18 TaxID=3380532 RepID=UPI003B7936CC